MAVSPMATAAEAIEEGLDPCGELRRLVRLGLDRDRQRLDAVEHHPPAPDLPCRGDTLTAGHFHIGAALLKNGILTRMPTSDSRCHNKREGGREASRGGTDDVTKLLLNPHGEGMSHDVAKLLLGS